MGDVARKEEKSANDKKEKVVTHIQAIQKLEEIQGDISDFTDLEILSHAKEREEVVKLAMKNAVDCTFSMSILPELKKIVEINNFGKQLKNALRDQEVNSAPKHPKSRKQTKRPNKLNKPKNEPKTTVNKDIKEINEEISHVLNESNI